MHRGRSVLNWIVQINFGLKPNFGFNFGLKLKPKQKIKWPIVRWQFLHSVCIVSLPKYLAPEVLCTSVRNELFYFDDDGCVSETLQDTSLIYASSPRTDVWSFGIILLEFLLVSFKIFIVMFMIKMKMLKLLFKLQYFVII